MVLDCYRLARLYHVSPDVFLSLPVSQVQLHLWRSYQLNQVMEQETTDQDG